MLKVVVMSPFVRNIVYLCLAVSLILSILFLHPSTYDRFVNRRWALNLVNMIRFILHILDPLVQDLEEWPDLWLQWTVLTGAHTLTSPNILLGYRKKNLRSRLLFRRRVFLKSYLTRLMARYRVLSLLDLLRLMLSSEWSLY